MCLAERPAIIGSYIVSQRNKSCAAQYGSQESYFESVGLWERGKQASATAPKPWTAMIEARVVHFHHVQLFHFHCFQPTLIQVPVDIVPVYGWVHARTITSHLDPFAHAQPCAALLRLTPTRSQRLTKPQRNTTNPARFFCHSLKLALPCQTACVNAQIVFVVDETRRSDHGGEAKYSKAERLGSGHVGSAGSRYAPSGESQHVHSSR
jgi:hypothetical protein